MSAAPPPPAETGFDQRRLDEKFQIARVMACLLWPYLAPGLHRLTVRWTDPGAGPAMTAVDRFWRLYLARDWVSKVAVWELALTVACHELQHLLLGHTYRCEEYRNIHLIDGAGQMLDLPNLAGDIAIGECLPHYIAAAKSYTEGSGHGFQFPADMKVPDDHATAASFKDASGKPFPPEMSTEVYCKLLAEIADKAPKVKVKVKCQCGTGSGAPDSSAPWEDKTPPVLGDSRTGVHPDESEIIRQGVAKAVEEAARKSQGSVPAHLRLWADFRLAPPKISWERKLQRAIRDNVDEIMGRMSQTFSRPNRRTAGSPIILPGQTAFSPRVLLVFDTSGSMGPKDYQRSFSEAQGIIRSKMLFGNRGIPCIACDAAADKIQWVRDVREFQLTGGGGTDMMAGIHAASRLQGGQPGVVVVLTDGYTSWDSENPYPKMNVIAVVTTKDAAEPPPWIHTVRVDD